MKYDFILSASIQQIDRLSQLMLDLTVKIKWLRPLPTHLISSWGIRHQKQLTLQFND